MNVNDCYDELEKFNVSMSIVNGQVNCDLNDEKARQYFHSTHCGYLIGHNNSVYLT